MLKVITVTNQPERAKPLLSSLTKFGWDWVCIEAPWRGFGTKLIETYNYLKLHPEVDQFIFCDAHDVIALGTPGEFDNKLKGGDGIILNAEKGCWPPPVQHFKYLFTTSELGFDFLNSGVYYAPSKLFMQIFEATPTQYETDDQWWFNMVYLFGALNIVIDSEQKLFNCHSFIRENEYTYENNRVQINGNEPIFIHANGGVGMPLVYDLLK